MHPIEVPRIIPGMTLAVAEPDYCYGTGMALLIVQSITVDQQLLASLEWVVIHCIRLRPDGAVLGPDAPLIRTRALAAAVRPTGWLPGLDQQHTTATPGHRDDQDEEHDRG